ncbi:hypothetical protein GCM10023238_15820 [Streptomyces heliomycini]
MVQGTGEGGAHPEAEGSYTAAQYSPPPGARTVRHPRGPRAPRAAVQSHRRRPVEALAGAQEGFVEARSALTRPWRGLG